MRVSRGHKRVSTLPLSYHCSLRSGDCILNGTWSVCEGGIEPSGTFSSSQRGPTVPCQALSVPLA